MKQKHILWLAALLLLALLGAYFAGVFDDDVSTVQVPEIAIEPDRVSAVSLHSPEIELSLEKSESGWFLTQPIEGKADSATVARLLADLDELELTNVVSRSPERYEQFGVDSSGTTLIVTSGESRQTLVIGGRSADYASNYIRLGEDERVFLSREAVDVPDELDRWRDRTIVDVSPETVEGATVSGPGTEYTLVRTGSGWTIDGEKADSSAVVRWLDRFNPLTSDGFFQGVEVLSDSTVSVTLQTAGGGSASLRFVPQETDYAVNGPGSGTTYRLRTMRLDQFVPERSYFSGD